MHSLLGLTYACAACAAGLDQQPRRIRRMVARGQIKLQARRPGLLITPKPFWPMFDSTLQLEGSDYEPPAMDGEHWLQPDGLRMRYYHDVHCLVSAAFTP